MELLTVARSWVDPSLARVIQVRSDGTLGFELRSSGRFGHRVELSYLGIPHIDGMRDDQMLRVRNRVDAETVEFLHYLYSHDVTGTIMLETYPRRANFIGGHKGVRLDPKTLFSDDTFGVSLPADVVAVSEGARIARILAAFHSRHGYRSVHPRMQVPYARVGRTEAPVAEQLVFMTEPGAGRAFERRRVLLVYGLREWGAFIRNAQGHSATLKSSPDGRLARLSHNLGLPDSERLTEQRLRQMYSEAVGGDLDDVLHLLPLFTGAPEDSPFLREEAVELFSRRDVLGGPRLATVTTGGPAKVFSGGPHVTGHFTETAVTLLDEGVRDLSALAADGTPVPLAPLLRSHRRSASMPRVPELRPGDQLPPASKASSGAPLWSNAYDASQLSETRCYLDYLVQQGYVLVTQDVTPNGLLEPVLRNEALYERLEYSSGDTLMTDQPYGIGTLSADLALFMALGYARGPSPLATAKWPKHVFLLEVCDREMARNRVSANLHLDADAKEHIASPQNQQRIWVMKADEFSIERDRNGQLRRGGYLFTRLPTRAVGFVPVNGADLNHLWPNVLPRDTVHERIGDMKAPVCQPVGTIQFDIATGVAYTPEPYLLHASAVRGADPSSGLQAL